MESLATWTDLAAICLLVLLALLFLFHLLVLAGIVPATIIWGGRTRTSAELLRLEIVSLLILVIAAFLVAARAGYLNVMPEMQSQRLAMWGLFGFFCLNMVGNLFAETKIEKYGFGSLTLIMALLALVLAVG